ncbi:MAG: SprT family zinc-dependent metalloprotease [Pseudomonadota bacterium]
MSIRRLFGKPQPLPPALVLSEPPVTVSLRVNARARRFTLRLAGTGKGAVLTMPPGVPLRQVETFLHEHRGWLARALAQQPDDRRPFPGALLPIDGVPVPLVAGTHRGAPRLVDGRLVLPRGPKPGPAAAAWLKERARARLVPAVHHFAEALGREPTAVSLRDTRSRWGSCTSAGRISFSWRLAMAPVEVQDYVAAHEAAHLREMNHSPRYWAHVARLMPDYARRRAWLRREGRDLHAWQFDG